MGGVRGKGVARPIGLHSVRETLLLHKPLSIPSPNIKVNLLHLEWLCAREVFL